MEQKYPGSLKEAFSNLGASENGLSSQEAKDRIVKFGLNEISEKSRRTGLAIFFSQLKSPLILILIGASIIAFYLGETTDSLIILGIILLNTFMGFYQEYRSDKALKDLKKFITFKSKVLRDNKKTELDSKELVPGDIIFLNIGDIVPADAMIIDSQGFSVNESLLTGESISLFKTNSIPSNEGEKNRNIAFQGTSVSSGYAKCLVISIGKGTEFGKTATVLSVKIPETDFQKNIRKFGNFLLKVILILTILVFAVNALLGKPVLDSFLFALAIAVGITPELLPIIITIALSSSAVHLAKKKVVVKKLVSIEDLGNIDVLCMDKTGTLTENNIVLRDYMDHKGRKSPQILEFSALCNSAIVEKDSINGNPIDTAVLKYIKEKGELHLDYKKIQDIEFNYERKRASVIVEKKGRKFLICKGEPESLLSISSYIEDSVDYAVHSNPRDREFEKKSSSNQILCIQENNRTISIKRHEKSLRDKYQELSKQGYKVIAVAYKPIPKKTSYSESDEKELIFLGFLIFIDPPKKSAIESIQLLKNLGLDLKVLTGDNEFITKKICEEINLEIKGEIILGSELEKMDAFQFTRAITENNVFARITPDLKYNIVTNLSRQGHIVGFLGDGVNDAPALRIADVGITVDSAVDIAKDSADIVLLEKSLDVLADGIKDGRKTFGNITKYIINTVSANFGNMFTLATSSLFFKFIPLLPSQILLANLVSDGPLTTISTDNVDESYLHKPKRWNIKMISRSMVSLGIISSLFDVITILVLYFLIKADVSTFRTGWFLESVISEVIITFSIRTNKSFWKSKPSKALIYSSLAAVAITIGLIYSPLAFLFQFDKLPVILLAAIAVILLGYFTSVEIAKRFVFKESKR